MNVHVVGYALISFFFVFIFISCLILDSHNCSLPFLSFVRLFLLPLSTTRDSSSFLPFTCFTFIICFIELSFLCIVVIFFFNFLCFRLEIALHRHVPYFNITKTAIPILDFLHYLSPFLNYPTFYFFYFFYFEASSQY